MTHSCLIELAAMWLRKKCCVVITDMSTGSCSETPDAIGWHGRQSTVIECKASRSDFRKDGQKPFRLSPKTGMGDFRYFMAPKGLIQQQELPEAWGLLEALGDGCVRVAFEATKEECSKRHETFLLLSALRRVGQTPPAGVSVRAYQFDSKGRATLGVEVDEISQTE